MNKTIDKDKKVRKSKGITLNIIASEEECSKEESDRRLVEFFSVLYEWHLEDQNKLNSPDKP
jgi:hypothetical protein